MRVAIVTESFLPTLNGVTNSVCRVLDHLRDQGHEAIVLCPQAGAPADYRGFPVIECPAIGVRQFPVGVPSPFLAARIAAFAPDVVHVASPFLLGFQAITVANRLGIASVAVYQTDLPRYAVRTRVRGAERMTWALIRRIHREATITLAPSSAAEHDLARHGVERILRWGRGVEVERFHPRNRTSAATTALRARLAPAGQLVVGYVGRLAPEKEVQRLAALRGLEGLRVLIVGDGPSRVELEHELAGMPVAFAGAKRGADLDAHYAACDVFVHTGCEETFGQTIQEAKATGLPVVVPRAGGPIDLVKHGLTGFFFEPDGPRGGRVGDDLRAAVRTLRDDPALRARMGEAARRSVVDRSWSVICDELVAHYALAMSAQRSSAIARWAAADGTAAAARMASRV